MLVVYSLGMMASGYTVTNLVLSVVRRQLRASWEMWTCLGFPKRLWTVRKKRRKMKTWSERRTLSWAATWSESVWRKTRRTAMTTTSVSYVLSKLSPYCAPTGTVFLFLDTSLRHNSTEAIYHLVFTHRKMHRC